jgi:hypothetical protein
MMNVTETPPNSPEFGRLFWGKKIERLTDGRADPRRRLIEAIRVPESRGRSDWKSLGGSNQKEVAG